MRSFGPFTVDTIRRTITKAGVPVRMTHKCAELLVAFVQNPGRTLTKEQLLEAAWGDTRVSDATLAQHVFLLRKAIEHEGTSWIRTVPNVGYCFTGGITEDAATDLRSAGVTMYADAAKSFLRIGTERSLRSAIDVAGRAIALDDRRASPFVARARAWRLLAQSMYAEPLPCLEAAYGDARTALARDASHVDAQIECAITAALFERDMQAAHLHLAAAERIAPLHPLLADIRVLLALMNGETDEALHAARKHGGELYASVLYLSRDFTRAREESEKDGVSPGARLVRGACLLRAGDERAALSDFQSAYYGNAHQSALPGSRIEQYAAAYYIYTLAKTGDDERARNNVEKLDALERTRYVSPMARAVAHLGLGDTDRALALVGEALDRRDPWSVYVPVDPILDELRTDPRFGDLMQRAA